MTAQHQRNIFAKRLENYCKLPPLRADDWTDLFNALASQTRKGRVIILLDEITWMAMDDPTFLGKLKNIWDLELKKNHELILILCGSVSGWIEENIISSTGYFGRIPVTISLDELPLPDCNELLECLRFVGSNYEKFQILSITGGIPYYLEQIQPNFNADQNIRNLCFEEDSLLVKEFDLIFHDIFNSKSDMYKKIVTLLASGSLQYNEICDALSYPRSGKMSKYLNDLIVARFLSRDYTWHFKNGKTSRLSKYRLSDNYLLFYLKYIEPSKDLIEQGLYESIDFMSQPDWYTVMGNQFENLVLKNRKAIIKLLGINPAHIVANNPYFQRKTNAQNGCQIDFLIQTKFNTIFVCEIRFSKNKLDISIISEVRNKINNISKPRGFAFYPVLIHINGVSDSVPDSGHFTYIIDFNQLLHHD